MTFRVFSEAISMGTTDRQRRSMRFYGGEIDGPSRQLARYIDKLTDDYMTNLDAIMIYRLDRFGRGGHHRPFNDEGFTGVRIMETHENYNEQLQRNLVPGLSALPTLRQRNFLFDWDYSIGYDVTKSLKLNFRAANKFIYDSFESATLRRN